MLIISSIATITILGFLWDYTNPEFDGFEKKSAEKWLKNAFISNIGIGSVLEYMKNNDEAKQLPDNALKAINYYLKEIPKEDANKSRE